MKVNLLQICLEKIFTCNNGDCGNDCDEPYGYNLQQHKKDFKKVTKWYSILKVENAQQILQAIQAARIQEFEFGTRSSDVSVQMLTINKFL